MMQLIKSDKRITGPVNMGNPHEFRIVELTYRIMKLIGSQSKITFKGLTEDGFNQRQPAISLAKANLDKKNFILS